MLYTKHKNVVDATPFDLFTVPDGFHAIIHYIFIANHGGSTNSATLYYEDQAAERIDIFDTENVSQKGKLTLDNGGGPMFALHDGETVTVQAGSAGDMEFAVTFDLVEVPQTFNQFV